MYTGKYSNITENQLSSKEREKIPDKLFGLPDERKYPLNDEEHVRKAIQFFKYCPLNKKAVLALNINKRAKQLNMTFHIQKGSPFYNYADKSIVKESTNIITESVDIDLILPPTKFPKDHENIKIVLKNIQNFNVGNEDELVDLEKSVLIEKIPYLANIYKKGIKLKSHQINIVSIVNEIMKEKYDEFYNFFFYQNECIDDKNYKLKYKIMNDLAFVLKDELLKETDNTDKYLGYIKKWALFYPCNTYYMQRCLEEIDFQAFIILNTQTMENLNYDLIKKKQQKIENAITYVKESTKTENIENKPLDPIEINMLNKDISYNSTEDYLATVNNELKNQINIILMTNNNGWNYDLNFSFDNKPFYLKEVPRENRDIFDIIDYLTGSIRPNNLSFYKSDLTTQLDNVDLMKVSKIKNIKNIYMSKDINSDTIYFGLNTDYLCLICKSLCDPYIYLIKLFDKESLKVESNLVSHTYGCLTNLPIQKVIFNSKENNECLTEGINVDKDGNIKFIFSPKKTFMDEYSENHKLLIENFKNKNYDGMKTNLAFLFTLINSIERQWSSGKIDKKKNHEWYEKATKARMFSINDFKTYLKEVQKNEPTFDFSKYYYDGGFDKYIIDVPHETILGIKKILKTIILA
jgi:hypothetical protein